MSPGLAPGSPVVLVEPEAGGHHFLPYLRFLAELLQRQGHPLTLLTTAAAAAHPAMPQMQAELPHPLPWRPMRQPRPQGSGTLGLLRRQLDYWSSVREAARSIPDPETTFILMSADALDRAIALLGSPFGARRFVALFIQVKFHWPALGIGPGGRLAALSRLSFLRVLAHPRLLRAVTIDASLLQALARHPRADRLGWVPDPGEVQCGLDRPRARQQLGLPATAFVVLVYGVIDERKGLEWLLRAVGGVPERLVIMLAGRFAPGHAERLNAHGAEALRQAGRLYIRDRYVDAEEEGLLFRAADLVWLGYAPTFNGQSAVLAQAASMGVPVLGKSAGLIGRTIREASLGLTVEPLDTAAVSAALRTAMDLNAGELAPGMATFAASRSAAAYRAAWLTCLSGTGG